MGRQPNIKPVREFRQRVERDFRITQLIAFGSRVRGTARPESDWDVVVVSPDFSGLKFRDRIQRMTDYWDYHRYTGFEPLPYTPEEFARKSKEIGIVAEAVREGIEVH